MPLAGRHFVIRQVCIHLCSLIKGTVTKKDSKKFLKMFVVIERLKTTALHYMGMCYSGPGIHRIKQDQGDRGNTACWSLYRSCLNIVLLTLFIVHRSMRKLDRTGNLVKVTNSPGKLRLGRRSVLSLYDVKSITLSGIKISKHGSHFWFCFPFFQKSAFCGAEFKHLWIS